MTDLDKEIKNLYEEQEFSVEDIVTELGGEIDILAIKMSLAQHSTKYQTLVVDEANYLLHKNRGKALALPQTPIENNGHIGAGDKNTILSVMKSLMLHSDNDMVKARVAIYLHEEVTGRNAQRVKQNALPNLRESVLALNDKIMKAQELVDRKMKNITNSPMMIEAEVVGK